MNTAISAKNHNYLWYRDYRDSCHLDNSTIVRFGIAIYRDNLQYRAAITLQSANNFVTSSSQRRVPLASYKFATLKDRKPFSLIVLDAPSRDRTPADIRIHYI